MSCRLLKPACLISTCITCFQFHLALGYDPPPPKKKKPKKKTNKKQTKTDMFKKKTRTLFILSKSLKYIAHLTH